MLVVLALFKIRTFLESGLRLRTACDLECETIIVKRPQGFNLPEHGELDLALPGLIEAAKSDAGFEVTTVKYVAAGKKANKGEKEDAEADANDSDSEG